MDLETGTQANRTYKDTMFRDLFGKEERKANALSLYNALNGTSYDDPDLLELTTIKDAIYMHVKNDVSFVIGSEMVLWEHQSTHNPNMPLRGLQYLDRLYSAWVAKQEKDLYGKTLIMLPRPRYVVFYVGQENRPRREVLRLSDAYLDTDVQADMAGEDALEVVATVINVNEGMWPELEQACETLAGYVHFIALVRAARQNGMSADEAVDAAVEECIAEGVLADYLASQRAAVKAMFITEFNEELHDRTTRAEGREEGLARGREEGLAEGRAEGRADERIAFLRRAAEAVRSGRLSAPEAADLFGFSEAEIMATVGEANG